MKIRRMMTTLYLSVDTQTGMYKIANAGHCYPVIVKKGGNETRFVEFEGSMPLGVVKKAKLETKEDVFNPGDIMFLYTDGIIEAANAAGESLGFDGFSELLKKSYNENIELYYETLFAAYKDWSPTSSDDLTLVIIKYD
jgi:sigma-B regulation protein RsbU (phosphoserine phosphatase)